MELISINFNFKESFVSGNAYVNGDRCNPMESEFEKIGFACKYIAGNSSLVCLIC